MRFRTLLGMLFIGLAVAGWWFLAGAIGRQAPRDAPPDWHALTDAEIDKASEKIAARDLEPEARAAAYVKRATLYFARGESDLAIADYHSALGLLPEDSAIAISIHWRLVKVYKTKGEPAKAIAECDILLRIAPEGYWVYLQRGALFSETGEYGKATADLGAAIALRPYGADAYQARARAYAKAGDYDEALADFNAVIRLKPDLFWPRYERAQALAAKGERLASWRAYAGVIGHVYNGLYREIVRLAKAPAMARLQLRAQEAVDRWDLDGAIAAYTEMIRLEPKVYDHYLRRGDVYLWSGRNEEALADFRAAVRIAPIEADPHWYLGDAYGRFFQFPQAIAELDVAICISPDKADLFQSRARYRYALGHYSAAATDLEKARRLEPDDAYTVIWLHLVRVRMGIDDREELRRNAANLEPKFWPEPVILYFMNEMTDARVQELAADTDDYWTKRNQRCEADFYLGLSRVDRGDKSAALPLLQSAARDCHPGFVEFIAAPWELRRMAASH